MKILLTVALLLTLAYPLAAQNSPDQFLGAGASYNAYSDTPVSFNVLYSKKITGNTYSFTFVDIISKTITPFTVTPMITTGIAQELFKIGGMPIYGTTGIGIATTTSNDGDIRTNVGYAWTAGFAPCFRLNKSGTVKLLPNVRVIKSSLTDFQGIYGIIIGWGK